MATLVEMAPQVKFLYDLLANEEIDAKTFNDTFDGMDANKKLENSVYVQKQLEADYDMFKKEKDRLEDRMRVIKNNIESIKNNILAFMQITGLTRATAGTYKIRVGKIFKTLVTDEEKVPQRFFVPQKSKLNLIELKKELKNGALIEGAKLVEQDYIAIR